MNYYKRYVSEYLGDEATPELVRRMTKAVINRPLIKIAIPLGVTLAMAFLIVLATPLFEYAEGKLGVPALVIHSLIIFPMLVAITFLIWGVVRRSSNARRALHQELLSAGIRPVKCLYCNYFLAGSVSSKCPECGAELASAKEPDA